jgi:hypothetical protein
MKLHEIYNLISESTIVYHGTNHDFNEFDVEKIGTSTNLSKGGWGIYFSEDPEISRQYITNKGKIHKYKLFSGRFFDFDNVMVDTGDEILRGLENHDVDESEIEEFQTDFIEYQYDVTNRQVYEWLSYVFNDEKGASMFLRDLGYDGNLYKDKTNPDVNNYAIYNLDIIKRI